MANNNSKSIETMNNVNLTNSGIESKTQYLGESGLTNTSGEYYATLAKELYESIEESLSSIRFYETSIEIIGSDTKSKVQLANSLDFSQIRSKLETIGKSKSFIAWIREAMKEKEQLGTRARNWDDPKLEELLSSLRSKLDPLGDELMKLEHPECQRIEDEKVEFEPIQPCKTELDIRSQWTIKDWMRFLYLETMVSVIGKFIHKDGHYNKAKSDLIKIVSNPIEVTESGRDTIIRTYTPMRSIEEVEVDFKKLQQLHRSFQSELNGIRNKIKLEIEQDALRFNEETRLQAEKEAAIAEETRLQAEEAKRLKSDAIKALKQKIADEKSAYEASKQILLKEESNKRIKLSREVENLKIVIPNDLKDLLESLKKED